MNDTALEFLLSPRQRSVDIEVTVSCPTSAAPGPVEQPVFLLPAGSAVATDVPVRVESRHSLDDGTEINRFSITWAHGRGLSSEYNWGLSLFHDVKDHRLYGLGITYLTEFQTIVQTYYGRVAARDPRNAPGQRELWEPQIIDAIETELFGPRGPRVYGPRSRALLDAFAPHASEIERSRARLHMTYVCFDIMLPPLIDLYTKHAAARLLQRRTAAQPNIIEAVLGPVRWADQPRLLLTLADNVGYRRAVRAGVDDEIAEVTAVIAAQICAYEQAHGLVERFGPIFDVAGYLLPRVVR